ncbi:hypothetical protein TRFO_08111 [Tritrichomonas foetus]|uniref:Uncharacterized protein n=1 Tax=Tritrichomonas foetus TaxID=1144522 RepID=A0A1J4JS93_9EUKA|nr:hypothetical protein TRFO_08111 [Tritrichomonas foetus]|eukprot:OHT00117.1 hypothetical protein TRFO_08111 [Tritrichomonas foetus]
MSTHISLTHEEARVHSAVPFIVETVLTANPKNEYETQNSIISSPIIESNRSDNRPQTSANTPDPLQNLEIETSISSQTNLTDSGYEDDELFDSNERENFSQHLLLEDAPQSDVYINANPDNHDLQSQSFLQQSHDSIDINPI